MGGGEGGDNEKEEEEEEDDEDEEADVDEVGMAFDEDDFALDLENDLAEDAEVSAGQTILSAAGPLFRSCFVRVAIK